MERATGPTRARTLLLGALAAVALARFALVVYAGIEFNRGDFYATMPPAYAEWLNPALWNDDYLSRSWVFQRSEYLYGPTQYLSVAPLVYAFDTFQQIADVLLVLYGALIAGSVVIMRRAVERFGPAPTGTGMAMAASTFAFLPLLQAYSQREFEIVVFFGSVCALYLVLARREGLAAAVAGYVTWFKFLPVLWFGYFVLRRWNTAVAAYLAVTALIWAAAYAWLGLDRFTGLWEVIETTLGSKLSTSAVCANFGVYYSPYYQLGNTNAAGISHALCRFQMWWPWFPAPALYWLLLTAMLAAFLYSFWRIERGPALDERTEAWRRALEISMVIIVTCGYFHAHFYYLAMLLIVINLLLARYLAGGTRAVRLAILLAAYAFLTAFVIPPALSSRIIGVDAYQGYMRHGLYFIGELALIGLVWFEYWRIASVRRPAVS